MKNISKPIIQSELGELEPLLMRCHRTLVPNFMRGAFPRLTAQIRNVVLFMDCGDYSRSPAVLHNRYTIIVNLSETVEAVFDNLPLRVPPDHWVLLFPFQRHGYRKMDNPQGHRRIHIQFDIDHFDDDSFLILQNRVFAASETERKLLRLIFEQVLPAEEQSGLSIVPHLVAAFIESRLMGEIQLPADNELSHQIAGKALRYIRDHFDRPLDIKAIAEGIEVSESHLRLLFRSRNGGMPLGRFIRWLKFYRAIEMLGNSELKMFEIAMRCGFGNQFSFSRFFKAKTGGISPLAYRREARKNGSAALDGICR